MKNALAQAGTAFFGLAVLEAFFMFIATKDSVAERVDRFFGPELSTIYFVVVFNMLVAAAVFFYEWSNWHSRHSATIDEDSRPDTTGD